MCIFPEFRSALWDKINIHHIPDNIQGTERDDLIHNIRSSYIRNLYNGASTELAEHTLIKAYSGEYNVHITMHDRIGAFERWAEEFPGSPGPRGIQSGNDIFMGANLLTPEGNLKPALQVSWLDTSERRYVALHETGHTIDKKKDGTRFSLEPEYKAAYSHDEFHVKFMNQVYKLVQASNSFNISATNEAKLKDIYTELKKLHAKESAAQNAPAITLPATLDEYISNITPDKSQTDLNGYLQQIKTRYASMGMDADKAVKAFGNDVSTAYHHVLFPKPPADIPLPPDYKSYDGFDGRCRESLARVIDLEYSQHSNSVITAFMLPHLKQQIEKTIYPELATANLRRFQETPIKEQRAGYAEVIYDHLRGMKETHDIDYSRISMEAGPNRSHGEIRMCVKGSDFQQSLATARTTHDNMERRAKNTPLENCPLYVRYDEKSQRHSIAMTGLDKSFAELLVTVLKQKKDNTPPQQEDWVNRSGAGGSNLPAHP